MKIFLSGGHARSNVLAGFNSRQVLCQRKWQGPYGASWSHYYRQKVRQIIAESMMSVTTTSSDFALLLSISHYNSDVVRKYIDASPLSNSVHSTLRRLNLSIRSRLGMNQLLTKFSMFYSVCWSSIPSIIQ